MSCREAKNALTPDVSRDERGRRLGAVQRRHSLPHYHRPLGGVHIGGEADESTQAEMRFLQSLGSDQKPIVAAVDGLANGIGTLLVFHCDFVIADATATLTSPLVLRGGLASAAHKPFVPRTLSHQRAFAKMVMGQSMSPPRGSFR
jgi:enoyl-CoA hydratase/carnithine racemase